MVGFSQTYKVAALVLMTMVCSCSGSQNRDTGSDKNKEIPLETYINVNRALVQKEQEKIEAYVQENNLGMQKTGTGLWYKIDEPGAGEKVKKGLVVELNYEIKLLNGEVCYNSDETGPKEFLVGQGGVESGLEEGILMLSEGSKASFILPPHLAHGLVGDDDKIPARSIIVYEVEVLNVKER